MSDDKRYRPSTVDLIAPCAVSDLQWAYDRVKEGRVTQKEICRELNNRLQAKELPLVSRSAFNRWAVHVRNGSRERPRYIDEGAVIATGGINSIVTSDKTRSALVVFLRALADDLERGSVV